VKRLIKICCIQNLAEAELSFELGADYVGLISAMPSGPGPIPEDQITQIISQIPDASQAVLLTSLTSIDEIIAQQQRTGAGVLQLCRQLTIDQLVELRRQLPGIELMPVVHVTGPDAQKSALNMMPYSDKLLLDSGSPNAAVPVLGGTGEIHDWSISAQIVREVDVPVFLAGGLSPGNVVEAIEGVNPAGVDICSGIRIDGLLDEDKLVAYVNAIYACDE